MQKLTEMSTAPANAVMQAHTYLAEGGPENLRNLHNFLSDTLLLTGLGFSDPVPMPAWGFLERESHFDAEKAHAEAAQAPTIGIIYYQLSTWLEIPTTSTR